MSDGIALPMPDPANHKRGNNLMAKTPAERMAMMRARRKAGEAWEPQPCGTPAAAFRHYKRSEKPCDLCREALRKQRLGKKGQEPDE